MNYDKITIYQVVQKPILDMKFHKGITISYAKKNIEEAETKSIEIP